MRPRDWAVLAALVCVAIAVRLVWLSSDPLWFDEAATLGIASMPWRVVLGPMAEAESSPPGYYALVKLWSGLFGADIVTVRFLSVAAGAASVAVVWRLAMEGFGARAAFVAAATVAFGATHVRLSQDARVYALLFLVAALALYAAHRLVLAARQRHGGAAAVVGLGAAMAAGLWLHPTAGIVALSLNAFVVAGLPWRHGIARGVVLLALADMVAMVLAAPPILAALYHVFDTDGYVDRWIDPPDIVETAVVYVRGVVGPFLGPLALVAMGLQAVLIGAALLAWWRRREPLVVALAAMLVAGAVLMPLVSQFRPVLVSRTILFLLLPLALLLGAGAAALPRRWAIAAVVPLLLLGAGGVARWHQWEDRKERWDLAAAYLSRELRPGDRLVVSEGAFVEISLDWHLRREGVAVPPVDIVVPEADLERLAAAELARGTLVRGTVMEPGRLCGQVGRGAALWLVMRQLPPLVQEDRDFTRRAEIRATLRMAGGHLVETHGEVGVDIEKWEVPPC